MLHIIKTFGQSILRQQDVDPLPRPINPGENPVTNALQIVFGVAGAIAMLIIVVSALKYVLSQGNPQETAKAKDTILYALVGLVVCALAFSIVTFVVERL